MPSMTTSSAPGMAAAVPGAVPVRRARREQAAGPQHPPRRELQHRRGQVDEQGAQAQPGQQPGQPPVAPAHVEHGPRARHREPRGDGGVHVVVRVLVGGQEPAGVGVVVTG